MILRILLALIFAVPYIYTNPHEIASESAYNNAFKKPRPAIFFIYGEHCPPCNALKPLYKEIALNTAFKDIDFYLIDSSNDALDTMLNNLEVHGLPTLLFTHKGKVILRQDGGLSPLEFKKKINEFRSLTKQAVKKTPKKKKPKKRIAKRRKNIDFTI